MSVRITKTLGVRAAALMIVGVAASQAAPITTQFVLTGMATPATDDLAKLQALPPTTHTGTFIPGTSSQTVTYTGTSLWTLLNGAGIVTNPAVKNDVLNRIVLATGSDGYRVVDFLGELYPGFRN